MTLSRIHVNQHVIRDNRKTGKLLPVFTVKRDGTNTYGSRVSILGPSELVYQPDRPLSCGAHVWIETHSEVVIEDAMSWSELKAQS